MRRWLEPGAVLLLLGGGLSCTPTQVVEVTRVAVCGDHRREAGELCDGADLGGQSCVTQGLGPGTLGCSATCDAFDTSGCAALPRCGDEQRDDGEVYVIVIDGYGTTSGTFTLNIDAP